MGTKLSDKTAATTWAAADQMHVLAVGDLDRRMTLEDLLTEIVVSPVVKHSDGIDIDTTAGGDGDVDLITCLVTDTPKFWWDESDSALSVTADFRLGDDTNYLKLVSATGQVALGGTYKQKLTMRPTLVSGRMVGTMKPTPVEVGIHAGYSMPIYASDDEEMFFREYIAGRWDGASDITISLIVALASAETVGEDFRFQLSWESVPVTGVLTTGTRDVEVQQELLTDRAAQYSVYKLDFTIDWDIESHDVTASDHFGCRIRRIAATGGGVDQVDGEIIVLDCIITYTVNKMYKSV